MKRCIECNSPNVSYVNYAWTEPHGENCEASGFKCRDCGELSDGVYYDNDPAEWAALPQQEAA
jgi:hypothetical protein